MAGDSQLRVALVGCGAVARDVHLPALQDLDGAEVVVKLLFFEAGHVERSRSAGYFAPPRAHGHAFSGHARLCGARDSLKMEPRMRKSQPCHAN